MKFNKIILPAIVCALALSSCEDNKMEWGKPTVMVMSTYPIFRLSYKKRLPTMM